MAIYKYTHIGTVVNHNCGKPFSNQVHLRETAKFWVTPAGDKYRKHSGRPAGATQHELQLDSIKAKALKPVYVGSSFDGRTNKWRIDCPKCNRRVCPPTTLLRHQSFECECGTKFEADWNAETVNVIYPVNGE